MQRKRIGYLLLTALLLTVSAAFPAFAEPLLLMEETVPAAEYPEAEIPEAEIPEAFIPEAEALEAEVPAAENTENSTGGVLSESVKDLDLERLDEPSAQRFAELVKNGQRIFDAAGVLTETEAQDLQKELYAITEQYGQDAAIVTVRNHRAVADMEKYADLLYYKGGLGVGADRDGSLLVIDFGTSDIYMYAQGGAMRYFTDRAIDQIYDSHRGGIVNPLSQGNYYEAMKVYTASVGDLYAQGVQQDQVNVDPETGETDPYYAQQKKPFVRIWQVIVSFFASIFSGLAPVNSVRKKYAMQAEKQAAAGVELSYRANAAFSFLPFENRVIGKTTNRVPIAQVRPSGSSGGHSSFGGGTSTMHHSTGGGSHTGGGRKF